MANKKTLNLEPIVKDIAYEKSLTYTRSEIEALIAEAVASLGIQYVSELPTGDNIKDKIYLVPDDNPKSDNMCDIWVFDRINNRWEHIDSLKFNIEDYTKISDIVDDLKSSLTNKPLSANQGRVLKELIDNKANSTHVHGDIKNNGTLNSDISSVNKVVVTDSSNNIKTISKLPASKVTHQDISGKVNVSDIIDNLDSTSTNKPLSANQGTVLKGLVNGKANNSHTHTLSDLTDLTPINITIKYKNGDSVSYNLFGEEV